MEDRRMEPDLFTRTLAQGPLYATIAAFLGGLLVCMTPCVYPMIAITVSVFGARQSRSRIEAMGLSTSFVLGIAAMFTPLGLAAGLTGSLFGSALSNPWVVWFISLVFLALAASMFGAFEFVLPSALTNKLSTVGGIGYGGAFLLGLVSGVIAAPCTGPVLTGILLWIGKTKSAGARRRRPFRVFDRARHSFLARGHLRGAPPQRGALDGGRQVVLRDRARDGGALFSEERRSFDCASRRARLVVRRRRRLAGGRRHRDGSGRICPSAKAADRASAQGRGDRWPR